MTDYNQSRPIDARHGYFGPLRKYTILSAEYTEENRVPYSCRSYYASCYPDSFTTSQETFEIKFERRGLERLLDKLDTSEREELLRQQNPALQKAREHYQTISGLVK